MRKPIRIVLTSLLVLVLFNEHSCLEQSTINRTQVSLPDRFSFQVTGRKLLDTLKWITGLANSEDSFVGRCFGVARRLKAMMPIVLVKLGIIVTTLVFLVIFSLKSLAIGVILLILNSGGLFGKLALLTKGHDEHHDHHTPHEYYIPQAPQPQPVHIHVHKDIEGHYKVSHGHNSYPSSSHGYDSSYHTSSHSHDRPYAYEHHSRSGHGKDYSYAESVAPTAWSDRISSGLSETTSLAEKLELINLYKRLGFNVNSVLSREANGNNMYT